MRVGFTQYCAYCRRPLCVICCDSGAHKDHNVQQLSEAHDLIQTAVEKVQKRPKYNAIVTELELEVLNTKVVQDHLIKRTNIIQYGRELHRLIDAVIEKYEKEACRAEVEDLNFLGSEISKYINVRYDMLMSYERNQNTISSRKTLPQTSGLSIQK